MAKDTDKLIRQLSLISFLMAEDRPVSAVDVKREVEGYIDMNDDAFARRFYADRAELESLGITLQVERPSDGFYDAELYALPPDNYYLPSIEFTDSELAALQTSLLLLDGRFAYAEPLRLALQQVSWGRPSPLRDSERRSVEMAVGAEPGGRELSQRLAKVETAISRRKTIVFTYYTIQRDATEQRKVDPYHLVFRGGQFYLIGHSHEREAVRVFRLSRIRGKVSYATKAEHDFAAPEDFDRRDYARRADWQLGELSEEPARIWIGERIAWRIERDFGTYGDFRAASSGDGPGAGVIFETRYAVPRSLVSWVLGWRDNAKVLGPPELASEAESRRRLIAERHAEELRIADVVDRSPAREPERSQNGSGESPIRPERFARLTTLAGVLIAAGREGRRLRIDEVREKIGLSEKELREDIEVLNIVNFGGGTYVLYAEIVGDEIEVDAEAYGDNFARPARLLPLEAKALVAAIDLLGDHVSEGHLQTAREKIVGALGHDPAEEGLEIARGADDSDAARIANRAITDRQILEFTYYKENEDEFSRRKVEPYRLENGEAGWYLECFDLDRGAVRHFKLERIKDLSVTGDRFEPRPEVEEQAHIEGWMTDGELPDARVARVWVSPERARWLAEERTVLEELADGAVVVEVPYVGEAWLVREILKGAGDLVVLSPEDAREAIRAEVA